MAVFQGVGKHPRPRSCGDTDSCHLRAGVRPALWNAPSVCDDTRPGRHLKGRQCPHSNEERVLSVMSHEATAPLPRELAGRGVWGGGGFRAKLRPRVCEPGPGTRSRSREGHTSCLFSLDLATFGKLPVPASVRASFANSPRVAPSKYRHVHFLVVSRGHPHHVQRTCLKCVLRQHKAHSRWRAAVPSPERQTSSPPRGDAGTPWGSLPTTPNLPPSLCICLFWVFHIKTIIQSATLNGFLHVTSCLRGSVVPLENATVAVELRPNTDGLDQTCPDGGSSPASL